MYIRSFSPVMTAATLHPSLGRFVRRLPVEKPVVRYNYTFQVVDPTTNRPGDGGSVDKDELGWSRGKNFQKVKPPGTANADGNSRMLSRQR